MVQKVGGSFRDPSGFLFRSDGTLYRQINESYRPHYTKLLDSGLYDRLVSAGKLVAHQELGADLAQSADAFTVIRPELVPFVSFPYEWSFSQLKAAALLTLDIQSEALDHDMVLKDASAYNVQFMGAQPVFIDTLSFEIYQPDSPWVAYRQFCQHFFAPLALMSYVDVRLGSLLQTHIDGIPLDLAVGLLPARARFRPSMFIHLVLHAKAQQRYSDVRKKRHRQAHVSRTGMVGLIGNLRSTISGLSWKYPESEWGDYYSATNYDDEAMALKIELVDGLLSRIGRVAEILDAGANNGRFSTVAKIHADRVVSMDIDPVAVDKHFKDRSTGSERGVLPLCIDITAPSPAIGWANDERPGIIERCDANVVLALALVHHLAISNNVPLTRIAELFHRIGDHLIIEFVPKTDSQVERLLATRADIFPDYTKRGFEEAFSLYYDTVEQHPVPGTERTLYLMKPSA